MSHVALIRRALARAPLALLAFALVTCSDPAGPEEPPPVEPVLLDVIVTPGDTTIAAIEDSIVLSARARSTTADVATTFVWQSRSPSIARVGQHGRVVAVAAGITWVIAAEPGGGLDSARITVAPRVAHIALSPGDTTRAQLRTQQFTAQATDAGGTPIANAQFTWHSTDTSVAVVSATGLVTAKAVGVDTIVVTAEGVSARAFFRVSALPALRFNRDTFLAGAGLTPLGGNQEEPGFVPEAVIDGDRLEVTVESSDTNVVVAPAIVDVPMGFDERRFTITGRATGLARITARTPGYDSAVAVVRVTTPHIVLRNTGSFDRPEGLQRLEMNRSLGIYASLADSTGGRGRATSPMWIRVRATTPGIVSPPADSVLFPAGSDGGNLGLTPVGPGRTWVHYESEGYRPDSVEVEVIPAKVEFTRPNGVPLDVSSIGVGQRTEFGVISVRVGSSLDTVAVTLTQTHPERLRLTPPEVRIAPFTGRHQIGWVGLAEGVDTVVATATGFVPDTVVVHVTRPHVLLSIVPDTTRTTTRALVRLHAADSLGVIHEPIESPVLRVGSSDPAVFDVDGDEVLIGSRAEYQTVPVGLGTATLTFTDPDGVYAPVTTGPITVIPSRLWFGAEGVHKPVVDLGLGQRLSGFGAHIFPEPHLVPVRIAIGSRNPRIAQPGVAELVAETASTAHYDIVPGDTTGDTWFVFTGAGLTTDSLQVRVRRPVLAVSGPASLFPGDDAQIVITLKDHMGTTRATREAVTFRLVSTDRTILEPAQDTVTIPAGASEARVWVEGHRIGIASILIQDVRTGHVRYEDGASPLVTVKSR